MHKTLIPAVAGLLSAALATFPAAPDGAAHAAPPRGPGGVALAVQTFLDGLDRGEPVTTLLVDERHDLEFTFDDGALVVVDEEDTTVAAWADVDATGAPFSAGTAAAFCKALQARVATDDKAGRKVRSEAVRVRANCASEQASMAIVEFTRCVTAAGAAEVRVPMRATALMRYNRNPKVPGQNFEIYHWHASVVKR